MTDKLIEALEEVECALASPATNAETRALTIVRRALAAHCSQQESAPPDAKGVEAEWLIAKSWCGPGRQVPMWTVQRGDQQFSFFDIACANRLVALLNATSLAPSESEAKRPDPLMVEVECAIEHGWPQECFDRLAGICSARRAALSASRKKGGA